MILNDIFELVDEFCAELPFVVLNDIVFGLDSPLNLNLNANLTVSYLKSNIYTFCSTSAALCLTGKW